MIPVPLIMGALGKVPWRLVGAFGLVAVVAFAGWRVSAWKQSHEALPGVRDALEREEGCLDGSKCADRVAALVARQDEFNREVANGYAEQLEDIRSRPVTVGPVRLCRPARPSGLPGAGATSPADGSAAARDVPREVSADIGRELAALADDCDAEVLKLKWLQEWNRALAAPHKDGD